jgi:hypothetical protein
MKVRLLPPQYPIQEVIMKKALSLLSTALFLVATGPLALAQEEGGESAPADEKATGEGEKKEADPWSVPDAAEKADEEKKAEAAEEAKPEIVAPNGYPTAEIDRPLALPRMTLEPLGEFNLTRMSFGNSDTNVVALHFGAGFGIIDNLEAGLRFPLVLSPDVDVGDMPVYGLYELGPFMDGQLRAAGRLTLNLPLQTDFGLTVDAPVKFKFHDMFAAIGGVGLGMTFADSTIFWLNFDFGALVQPMEALAFEIRFGFHIGIADNTATWIPLYFRGQYTLMGDLDVYAEFGFQDLNNAGADIIVFFAGAAYRIGL